MRPIDLTNVEEVKDFERPTVGGYICKITQAKDVSDKEYLEIEFDIAQGEYKDYYRNLYNSKNFWGGRFARSYKEKALPFFKAFITAVEKSNSGYKWNFDENTLANKFIGVVLAEEEYIGNDGSVKTRLYVARVRSVQEIQSGNYKVPEKKLLKTGETNTSGFTPVENDDELPFG